MLSRSKRLEKIEQELYLAGYSVHNNILYSVLSFGLLPFAVALTEKGRREEVRELIEFAAEEANAELTNAQFEWAVQRIENHLNGFRSKDPVLRAIEQDIAMLRQWNKETARAVQQAQMYGRPEVDPNEHYERTCEFWRQRGRVPGHEIGRKLADREHLLRVVAVWLSDKRKARKTYLPKDESVIYTELAALVSHAWDDAAHLRAMVERVLNETGG